MDIKYLGKTPDNKYAFLIGKKRREYTADSEGQALFKYTLFRLERFIKYKREKIALDNIK